jgi:uncharacterized lipoprotein YbaY
MPGCATDGVCHTGKVVASKRRSSGIVALLAVALALAGGASVVGATGFAPAGATTTSSQPARSSGPTKSSGPARSAPLSAPRTTFAQDTKYLTDITVADPQLTTYEQKQGNVALRALLTDGSAFCALLTRTKGIDVALVAEANGVRGTESQTHLPLSVTTFNTIEAVALLTLCPSETKRMPAPVRVKISALGKALAKRPG